MKVLYLILILTFCFCSAFGQSYGFRDTSYTGGGIPGGDTIDKIKQTAACVFNCFTSFLIIDPTSGKPKPIFCKSLFPCLWDCAFKLQEPSRPSFRSFGGLNYQQYAMMYGRQLKSRSLGQSLGFDTIFKFLKCLRSCLPMIAEIKSLQTLSITAYCWINTCVCNLNHPPTFY